LNRPEFEPFFLHTRGDGRNLRGNKIRLVINPQYVEIKPHLTFLPPPTLMRNAAPSPALDSSSSMLAPISPSTWRTWYSPSPDPRVVVYPISKMRSRSTPRARPRPLSLARTDSPPALSSGARSK